MDVHTTPLRALPPTPFIHFHRRLQSSTLSDLCAHPMSRVLQRCYLACSIGYTHTHSLTYTLLLHPPASSTLSPFEPCLLSLTSLAPRLLQARKAVPTFERC
eukprot:6784055-Prymnesium_polylepis.1